MWSDRLLVLGSCILLVAAAAVVFHNTRWHGPTLATLAGTWQLDAGRFDREVSVHPDAIRVPLLAAAQTWQDVQLIFSSDTVVFSRPTEVQTIRIEVVGAAEEPPFLALRSIAEEPAWQAEINLDQHGFLLSIGAVQLPFARLQDP